MLRFLPPILVLWLAMPCLAQSNAVSPLSHENSWTMLKQQMSTTTSLSIHNVPLDEVVDMLRARFGLTIHVDTEALDNLGFDGQEHVSVNMSDAPLGSMLEAMLRPYDLTWTFRFGAICITDEDGEMSHVIVRVYPIPDLLDEVELYENEFVADYDSVIDMLVSTVATDSWVENGGPEAEIRPLPAANALVISQSPRIHLQIEQLLFDLRRVRSAQGLSTYREDASEGVVGTRALRTRRARTYVRPTTAWRVPRAYGDSSSRSNP